MEHTYNYYKKTIIAYTRRVDNLKRKIHLLGTIRLLLTIGLCFTLWIFKTSTWETITGITILFLFPFILFMVWHNKLSSQKNYAEILIELCRNELKGLDYDFSSFDGAIEENTTNHSFCLDLDLFGNHSLFQSINRTVTHIGKRFLANCLLNPLADQTTILKRQAAIKELTTYTQLRQHFYVMGKMLPKDKNIPSATSIIKGTPTGLKHFKAWNFLIWIIPTIWLFIFVGYISNLIPITVGSLFFGISFLISYLNAKQIASIHHSFDQTEQLLRTYSNLIRCIERENFQASALKELQSQFFFHNQTASSIIKELSRHIGSLNQRFSAIGLILNIFILQDTRNAIRLEKWRINYGKHAERWFEALAQFDTYCSLGSFAFNHPNYVYPQMADSYFQMEGKALGHPLLHRDICVTNDIHIGTNSQFLIITGANMAGKSTYLRTIGINYLLGCIGVPVCAESLTLYPAQLVTSLRTTDSLAGNESYFFAELKRLKMIIDRLQQGEKLFIILDEILKGTNSIDKQKGSLALMKQLVGYQTYGIIATHDLVLGELEDAFPEQIKNYHFEADIQENELTFSYKLREGVAHNMNACFLMKKMGITV
ncbi:MAG: DNA mismatch repair protein MutS [Parabacteroides sp.]|nr:DNA mismatch repair protein MutS [Parabacteroides sp.]